MSDARFLLAVGTLQALGVEHRDCRAIGEREIVDNAIERACLELQMVELLIEKNGDLGGGKLFPLKYVVEGIRRRLELANDRAAALSELTKPKAAE